MVWGVFKARSTICRRNGIKGLKGLWQSRIFMFQTSVGSVRKGASSIVGCFFSYIFQPFTLVKEKVFFFIHVFSVFQRHSHLCHHGHPLPQSCRDLQMTCRSKLESGIAGTDLASWDPEALAPVLLHVIKLVFLSWRWNDLIIRLH